MISTLDLSSVTERLRGLLETAVQNSPLFVPNGGPVAPFPIEVSGSMPESVRNRGQCQLTMYLFHLQAEPFTRNMPLTGSAAQPNTRQALGLTLYYLLSAFSKDRPEEEQQAMSIAIKALHERGTFVDPVDNFTFTVTLEAEKPDEANRRWQSFSTAFRLSSVYRVSVVFLTPQSPPPVTAAPPRRLGLAIAPAPLPFATSGSLVATASRIDFAPFPPSPGDEITFDYSPAIVPPGGTFAVFGSGLSQPTAAQLYLVDASGVERDVTAWKTLAAQNTDARIVATLPAAIGALPGGSPEPGVYLIRAGDAATARTNSVPLSIAARADAPPTPWLPVAGVFTFTGAGFVDGETEVLLDTIALTAIAPGGNPNPGEFAISIALNNIRFQPPAGIAAGNYFVRVRVRGVEGPPVGRIPLP